MQICGQVLAAVVTAVTVASSVATAGYHDGGVNCGSYVWWRNLLVPEVVSILHIVPIVATKAVLARQGRMNGSRHRRKAAGCGGRWEGGGGGGGLLCVGRDAGKLPAIVVALIVLALTS